MEEEQDDQLDKLLSGNLAKLPPLPKRVVRLFISSTFTDMTLERNSLMEKVYPRLKCYCREKFGLDFQVVDMRWGVRDEATDDHQTVALCQNEIRNCQRVSLGPNFISLIGNKYGFRPLPSRIRSNEFRSIRCSLIELDINTDTLDTWYREDLNSVDNHYVLQPISSILNNFTNRQEPELQLIDQQFWQAIQERIHELLLRGSQRLVDQGKMERSEQTLKYLISVTEREIIDGCLEIEEPKSHCLLSVRSIRDLEQKFEQLYCQQLAQAADLRRESSLMANGGGGGGGDLRPLDAQNPSQSQNQTQQTAVAQSQATRKVSLKIGNDKINLITTNTKNAADRKLERTRRLIGKYIDLKAKQELDSDDCDESMWQVDAEAQAALSKLVESRLKAKFAASRNLIHFQVHWNEADGISMKSEEHKQYLRQLCDYFYQNLTRMIRSSMRDQQTQINSSLGGQQIDWRQQRDSLIGEVLQHSHLAAKISRSTHGRSRELDDIRRYVTTSGRRQQPPMFLYGVSGSGKTSILARAGTLARDWLLADANWSQQSDGQAPSWQLEPCVVLRFCATTPQCSSSVGMLASVCQQLQYNFFQFGPLSGMFDGQQQQSQEAADQLQPQLIPDDLIRLEFLFRRLLANCSHQLHRRRKFVLILDSIERLVAPSECTSLQAKYSWLTSLTSLPANVRLIVSCSSEAPLSWAPALDYLHLKRHFVLLYHQLTRGGSGGDQDETDSSDSARESTHSESSPTGRVQLSGSPDDDHHKYEAKYRMLKQLIVPTVRLRRKSSAPQAEVSQLRSIQLHRLSLNGRRRQSVKKSLELSGPTECEHETELRSAATEQAKVWILHVRPFGLTVAKSVLSRWLADIGRTLSQQQWSIVDKSLAACSRPIFVKLAFGEVINWKSYSVQSEGGGGGATFGCEWLRNRPLKHLADESDECVRQLRVRLREAAEHQEHERAFKWQLLAMEQQWHHYLDHCRREQADNSDEEANDNDAAARRRKASQGLQKVILTASTQATGGPKRPGGAAAAGSICHLSLTIDDAICQLFARIELQHGYVLTKHSLSYITESRQGLCENELEDILSLDDIVLDDVFQYHLPPVRRIPPLLWTRIRNDLADYLSERQSDGIVIDWHYNQFKLIARSRYLEQQQHQQQQQQQQDSTEQRAYIHSQMADYFLGKWANKAKPFKCTQQQLQMVAEQFESAIQASGGRGSGSAQRSMGTRLGSGSSARIPSAGLYVPFGSGRQRARSSNQLDQRLQWMLAKADRRVPHQPLFYLVDSNQSAASDNVDQQQQQQQQSARRLDLETDDAAELSASQSTELLVKRYNLRKLVELPFHLMHSGRFLELAQSCLFNYRWLLASIEALDLKSIFQDLNQTIDCIRRALSSMVGGGERKKQQQQLDRLAPVSSQVQLQLDSAPDGLQQAAQQQMSVADLELMLEQLQILNRTLRLTASSIQLDPQMLAAQLIGRLLDVVAEVAAEPPSEQALKLSPELKPTPSAAQPGEAKANHWLSQLIGQCYREAALHCALLPISQCLQSADGIHLSTFEDGNLFAITSIALDSDQRHLLACSNKFLMWDLESGKVARNIQLDLEPDTMMMGLRLARDSQHAVAYTSGSHLIALDVLTQQVAKFELLAELKQATAGAHSASCSIVGLKLIDCFGAKRFQVWTRSSWFVLKLVSRDGNDTELSCPSAQLDSTGLSSKIELEYAIDALDDKSLLGDLDRASCQLLEVDVRQLDEQRDLICLTIERRASDSSNQQQQQQPQVELVTLVRRANEASAQSSAGGTFELWPRLESACCCLKLSRSMDQLIFCDSRDGSIRLSRRRQLAWSRAKTVAELGQRSTSSGRLDLPFAIHLESHEENSPAAEQNSAQLEADQLSCHRRQAELATFERTLDAARPLDEVQQELSPMAFQFPVAGQDSERSRQIASKQAASLQFVKVYYRDRILVLQLTGSQNSASDSYLRRNFCLPPDIRNVRLQANECNSSSLVMQLDDEQPAAGSSSQQLFLVAALSRQILIFSMSTESLLVRLPAHSGRITSLLRVSVKSQLATELAADGVVGFATSSMDKTAKLWNLSNVRKDSQRRHSAAQRLDGPVEELSCCKSNQLPLVAGLARNQLAIWNWQTTRLLFRFQSLEQLSSGRVHSSADLSCSSSPTGAANFTSCKFTSGGRNLLAVGTRRQVNLVAFQRNQNKANDQFSLSNVAEVKLDDSIGGTLSKSLVFGRNDSHLMLLVDGGGDEDENERAKVSAVCYSIEALSWRKLYSVEARARVAPAIRRESSRPMSRAGGSRRRVCLPTLTKDQNHLVLLATNSVGELSLNVHSARDGTLMHSIDLSQLELPAAEKFKASTELKSCRRPIGSSAHRADNLSLLPELIGTRQLASSRSTQLEPKESQASQSAVRIRSCDRLKSILFRERRSVVALIGSAAAAAGGAAAGPNSSKVNSVISEHNQAAASHCILMVDVVGRQIVGSTENWNGRRLSADSRYALSRPLSSAAATVSAQLESRTREDQWRAPVGLQLLEAHSFRPVKTLVSVEQLVQLAAEKKENWAVNKMASCLCDFSSPGESFVYFYDCSMKRLLLVRLSDAKLVANYKFGSPVTRIKCASDGFVLVCSLADGSICSLATMDQRAGDSFARVAKFAAVEAALSGV